MLGTCFDLIALPLEGANLFTSRTLALSLMENLPDMVRIGTMRKMERQEGKRTKKGEASTDRDELMFSAR